MTMTSPSPNAAPVVAPTRPEHLEPQRLRALLYGQPASLADLETLAGLAAHTGLATWDLAAATGEPDHTASPLAPAPEPARESTPGVPAETEEIAGDLTPCAVEALNPRELRGVRLA